MTMGKISRTMVCCFVCLTMTVGLASAAVVELGLSGDLPRDGEFKGTFSYESTDGGSEIVPDESYLFSLNDWDVSGFYRDSSSPFFRGFDFNPSNGLAYFVLSTPLSPSTDTSEAYFLFLNDSDPENIVTLGLYFDLGRRGDPSSAMFPPSLLVDATFELGDFFVTDSEGTVKEELPVSSANISPVPLPAAALHLGVASIAFVWVGMRRRKVSGSA